MSENQKQTQTQQEQEPQHAQRALQPVQSSSSSDSDVPAVNEHNTNLKSQFWNLRSSHCTFNSGGHRLRSIITLTCAVGFSLFGYDQGIMSGIITAKQFTYTFPALAGSSRHVTILQGAVTSCYELGCFFGALFAMRFGEKYGRRPMIITGSLIFMLGALVSVFPYRGHWSLGHFVIARVVTGLGNGLNTATIPIYQSETSKPEVRGRLVNTSGSTIAVGTFIAYWINFGISYSPNSVAWRFPFSLQVLFGLILFIGIVGLPESPRWLVAQNRISEAAYVLGKLDDISPQDDQVLAEITLISDAINRFDKEQLTWKELLHSGQHQHFKRMIIGASSQFFQQWTGCNAAIYYSTVLFEETIGLKRRIAMVLGGIFSTIYVLFTIPSFFLIDRIGRRPLFLIGAVGQGISFLIPFGCLIHDTPETAKGAAVEQELWPLLSPLVPTGCVTLLLL
ncbi:unnamed protein product [Ambrosiozyma monospora]|uniref:Unnamed protein product n=1 Tax=Ambrosiozyma monospora TaxID=43982 RepID=A0A9W7DGR7_AMBMO|nr:unnamed protein product [Ambrosiozyma monospora]